MEEGKKSRTNLCDPCLLLELFVEVFVVGLKGVRQSDIQRALMLARREAETGRRMNTRQCRLDPSLARAWETTQRRYRHEVYIHKW